MKNRGIQWKKKEPVKFRAVQEKVLWKGPICDGLCNT